MSRKKTIIGCAISFCASIAINHAVLAYTCPTNLKQNSEGYWYSQEKPGWKSHKPTDRDVTISATDFGGVVYSPTRHRLACVYKASDGKWVALVSAVHKNIVIDKQIKDSANNSAAWKFNQQYKDFACGQPSVTNIEGCPFTFEDQ